MNMERFTKDIKNKQDYCEFELKNAKYTDLF